MTAEPPVGSSTAIENVATVVYDSGPAQTSPPTTVTVTTPLSSLVKTVDGSPFLTAIRPGTTLTYRLSFTRNAAAAPAILTDPLQSNQSFVGCSDGCTATGTPTVVGWDLGSVASGETVEPGAPVPSAPTTVTVTTP